MDNVDVILANNTRVTLRVGDTFLKIDARQERTDVEVRAMTIAPVPTPEILWRKPPVLALAALPGRTLGRLGEPASASAAAWQAVGAAIRELHEAPLPPWPAKCVDEVAKRLGDECDWLIENHVLPTDQIAHNRELAKTALVASEPAFIHGDLHLEHVFVDGDTVTGIIDWSEARAGNPITDLASLTLANEARVDDLLAGYGRDIDRDLIRAGWSLRCLLAVRWLIENGYGTPDQLPEVAVLRSQC